MTALEEIQTRLPIHENSFLKNLVFLKPEIALSESRSNTSIDFKLICETLGLTDFVVVDEIINEWRTLPLTIEKNLKKKLIEESVEQFWWSLSKIKCFDETLLFPSLSKLAKMVLSLPHTNADSERIFSIVTAVRTKKRNKLGHDSLNAVCIIRSHFQDCKTDCTKYNWGNHDGLYKKFKSNILYDHKK